MDDEHTEFSCRCIGCSSYSLEKNATPEGLADTLEWNSPCCYTRATAEDMLCDFCRGAQERRRPGMPRIIFPVESHAN